MLSFLLFLAWPVPAVLEIIWRLHPSFWECIPTSFVRSHLWSLMCTFHHSEFVHLQALQCLRKKFQVASWLSPPPASLELVFLPTLQGYNVHKFAGGSQDYWGQLVWHSCVPQRHNQWMHIVLCCGVILSLLAWSCTAWCIHLQWRMFAAIIT